MLFLGETYIKGFWAYSYNYGNEVRYGYFVIKQKLDSVTIHTYGITKDGKKRSEAQSVTPLISNLDDYQIVLKRKEYRTDGELHIFESYANATLHMVSRETPLSILNYPKEITGDVIVYGGMGEDKLRTDSLIRKETKAKNESDIKQIVMDMIEKESRKNV
jgi:hypothetical protein